MSRTIKEIRENNSGKVYVFCGDFATEERFLADAEKEGFMFGEIKPTESHRANIIAVEDDMQLAHVSTAGRIAFQTDKSVTRIDYAKYVSGDDDFLYTDK